MQKDPRDGLQDPCQVNVDFNLKIIMTLGQGMIRLKVAKWSPFKT